MRVGEVYISMYRGPKCVPTKTFDSAEVNKNVRNLLLGSPEKVSVLQSIMAVHLGHDTCSFSWIVPLSK